MLQINSWKELMEQSPAVVFSVMDHPNLPDGIASLQKSEFGYILEGLVSMFVIYFYCHLV
jgi:hypothetical protein